MIALFSCVLPVVSLLPSLVCLWLRTVSPFCRCLVVFVSDLRDERREKNFHCRGLLVTVNLHFLLMRFTVHGDELISIMMLIELCACFNVNYLE